MERGWFMKFCIEYWDQYMQCRTVLSYSCMMVLQVCKMYMFWWKDCLQIEFKLVRFGSWLRAKVRKQAGRFLCISTALLSWKVLTEIILTFCWWKPFNISSHYMILVCRKKITWVLKLRDCLRRQMQIIAKV